MEGAFTHVGNHLISDSAAAIKAGGDDLSTIDPDETLLYGKFGGARSGRRRADDDDNHTELYDDDDNDSLTSIPVDGMKGLNLRAAEEERELPPHACAFVYLVDLLAFLSMAAAN
jgi:regulator of nonsense transcripts 1